MNALHLPLDVARCQPEQCVCPQRGGCARANDWPSAGAQRVVVVDASSSLRRRGSFCPMFIDSRGAFLVAASQPAA